LEKRLAFTKERHKIRGKRPSERELSPKRKRRSNIKNVGCAPQQAM